MRNSSSIFVIIDNNSHLAAFAVTFICVYSELTDFQLSFQTFLIPREAGISFLAGFILV